MTIQNETNKETNNLRKLELEHMRGERDEIKRDRLKRLHKSVTSMILVESASHVAVDNELELRTPPRNSGVLQEHLQF